MPENTKDKDTKEKTPSNKDKKLKDKPENIKADEKDNTETKPKKTEDMEKKDTENTQDNPENQDSMSPLVKAGIIIIILAIAVFLVSSFFNKVDESTTEYRCKAFESDPTLNYPCSCVPLIDTDEKVMDDIEKQTQALCRCTCDIGNEEPYIVDIRVADE